MIDEAPEHIKAIFSKLPMDQARDVDAAMGNLSLRPTSARS
jgi:hypothetical protein